MRRAVDASDDAGERGEESRDEDARSRGARPPRHGRCIGKGGAYARPWAVERPLRRGAHMATERQRQGNIICGASDRGQGRGIGIWARRRGAGDGSVAGPVAGGTLYGEER